MTRLSLFGVPVDRVSMDEAVEFVAGRIAARKRTFITTPNPEFIVDAQRDHTFKRILQQADLAIPDGVGVATAIKLLAPQAMSERDQDLSKTDSRQAGMTESQARLAAKRAGVTSGAGVTMDQAGATKRITGIDLMLALCKRAAKEKWTIFLLGGKENVAEKTKQVLEARFPGIRIIGVGEDILSFRLDQLSFRLVRNLYLKDSGVLAPLVPGMTLDLLARMTARRDPSTPARRASAQDDIDLLFIALGHKKQEQWIANHQDRIGATVAMGVGGAFDYISGRIPRAPQLIQQAGFEWLFRLILQPWRIRRQWKLPVFVVMIIGTLSFRLVLLSFRLPLLLSFRLVRNLIQKILVKPG